MFVYFNSDWASSRTKWSIQSDTGLPLMHLMIVVRYLGVMQRLWA